MTLEKRGNQEIEVKRKNGQLVMIMPGTNAEIPYDGRFEQSEGFQKCAELQESQSTYYAMP
jgi:hypothetical protein